MQFGNDLPQGDARILFNRFSEFKGTFPEEVQALFPEAVCFTVSELREYLDKGDHVRNKHGFIDDLQKQSTSTFKVTVIINPM